MWVYCVYLYSTCPTNLVIGPNFYAILILAICAGQSLLRIIQSYELKYYEQYKHREFKCSRKFRPAKIEAFTVYVILTRLFGFNPPAAICISIINTGQGFNGEECWIGALSQVRSKGFQCFSCAAVVKPCTVSNMREYYISLYTAVLCNRIWGEKGEIITTIIRLSYSI